MQMQVPERIVSFYAATCGQGGLNLGSDEKEIILLVYVILDVTTGEIIGSKQVLVRPDGNFVKHRTVSTSSDVSVTAATTPTSPPLCNVQNDPNETIASANKYHTNHNNTNNNNGLNNNCNNLMNSNNSITNKCNASAAVPATNIASGNTNAYNAGTTAFSNGLALAMDNVEQQLPIAAAQAAGKPLKEAIEEFDSYLRSLSINEYDIKLVTDGQLPLRQCLHREACAKDITLPAIYNQFCDLRKEFLKFKSGDLSRALVPMKDIKKILQTPVALLPQSIDEMLKGLNLNSTEDSEFYVKESRDMVTIIQHMLKSGHQFMPTEVVNLVLEPGICSIDDDIDGNCIVRARGLPWQSSDQDIAKFFRGLNIAKGGVALCLSPLGRRNGEALIRFVSQEHRDMALKRHKHHIGPRYIEVYRATGEDFLSVAGGASNEAQAFLSKGAQVIIRMRGLPYDCTAKQVLDFFTTGEKPCEVLDGTEGVLFVKKPDGRATGDAFVLFANEQDAPNALGRHRESIGQRYIELFRSTTAEVQQVLNRSMDPKTYEQPHQQPPLIAQLPTMQLSLLPQHLITSGTTKNCIRLRGLPYEALVEHILNFLEDFAKHIIYQGVHMVINAQGQPSGEAFIQMDTEESARLCAQLKHNRFMVFGKKYRYIEVFQCSGDDMNMVLNGGLQSPPIAAPHPHAHHAAAAGKQTSLLTPGPPMLGNPFGPYNHFGPPILARAHAPHTHHHPAPPPPAAAAYFQHPLVYWPCPSPPVSPTTFYSQPTHAQTHIAAQHHPIYALDLIPQNYPSHPAALSPTNFTLPHGATANGLILAANKPATMTYYSSKQFTATLATPAPAATGYHAKITSPSIKPQAQHYYANYSCAAPAAVELAPAPAPTPQQHSTTSPTLVVAAPAVNVVTAPAPTPVNVPTAAVPNSTPAANGKTASAPEKYSATRAGADALQSEQLSTKKLSNLRTNAPIYKPSTLNAVNVSTAAATTAAVNSQGLVTTNQCVELFIS